MTLETLWARIAEIDAGSGLKCGRSEGCDGACCRPSAIGGEPGVTRPEIERINSYLAGREGFQFYEAGRDCCKFLGVNGRCRIYPVRPIDCRVHFCRDDSFASQPNCDVSDLVHHFRARDEAEYMATELIDSVEFLGES